MSRSAAYQYKYSEVRVDFSNISNLYYAKNPPPTRLADLLFEIDDEIKDRLWYLMETRLTETQFAIIKAVYSGATQTEVGKLLGKNQSSVVKSLQGNPGYREKKGKHYGGSIKKLTPIITTDDEIASKCKQIYSELDPKWDIRLPYYSLVANFFPTFIDFERKMKTAEAVIEIVKIEIKKEKTKMKNRYYNHQLSFAITTEQHNKLEKLVLKYREAGIDITAAQLCRTILFDQKFPSKDEILKELE